MADDLKTAFQSFDADNDGYLMVEELQKAAVQLGDSMTPEEIAEYVERNDTDRDGHLSFEEFETMLTSRGRHAGP